MSRFFAPENYKSCLNLYETQSAIGALKGIFEKHLCKALNLKRVSAPLFVDPLTGLNDNLSGVERPVTFDIPDALLNAEVVHSLAKWKRLALYRYGFKAGEGIYTDMNAIRRDERLDNTHSVYVDQWDWEKVISKEERNIEFLYLTVDAIVGAIVNTLEDLKKLFPAIKVNLERKVTFVNSQFLEDKYPDLPPEERENEIAKEYKTVFVTGIGGKLKSGTPHGSRAPDYDDWNLNGDIIFWNEILGSAFEISSMGIRVDPVSMEKQLDESGKTERKDRPFHKMVLDGTLPLTVGGGIGQSRLSMLLLGKAHIGEVQSSVWDKETLENAEKSGIVIL
ncbi:MAG: aspartate--ammonia ligase [Clostridiales bacterium]|jgi:aspartate--ammonia ligase|nr:aspartate--ammonia ligase [Clostridiales bacterium]